MASSMMVDKQLEYSNALTPYSIVEK